MVSKFIQKIYFSPQLYKLYLLGPSMFFQFNFDVKVYFCFVLVPVLKEEIERSLIPVMMRENP